MTKYHQTKYLLVGKDFIATSSSWATVYVLLFENQVSLSYCPRQNIQTAGLDFLPAEN